MDKKIIALVVALVVIAVLFVFNPFKQPPAETPEDENVGPGPLDVLSPEELAAHEAAVQQSDPVRYQALKEKNVAVCDTEPKAEDIDWCKAAVAEATKDASVCPTLSGFAADQCYYDVGRAKDDLELCKKVSQQHVRDACIYKVAVLLGNLDECYQAQDSSVVDSCIAEIALDKNDASICSKVSDELFRQDCETNITG